MKFDYIWVSLAIASLGEAAPIKRGFFDELFGISTTTSTPIVAIQAATTPIVQAATVAAAVTTAAVTTPVAEVAVATTSSSVGFWGRLFGGGRTTSTTQAVATTAPATTTPVAVAVTTQATSAAAAAAVAVAATTTISSSSTSSGGFLSNLLGSLFGSSSSKTSSSIVVAISPTTTQTQAVAATTPIVLTSQQVFTTVVTPVASTAATAVIGGTSPSTTTSSSGSDLFSFLFGDSGSGSGSSSSIVNSAGSSNPLHGSGIATTSTGSTLGITFQGGGTATTSVNDATVTVEGSSAGATAAAGAFGITYSPYTDQDTCKSATQVSRDVELLSGYTVIRLYGTDCSGIENVMAAMGSNQKIYIGVWNIDSPDSELQDIVSAVSSSSRGWDAVHTIAIGNERVNAGAATVAQVKAAVDTSRLYLESNGYTGSIVTVDTLVAYIANPELCEISDYLAVNCHPYWDGNVSPGDSGPWLVQQISSLQSVCGTSKDVLITESGWPTEGQAYGSCVPSVENQVEAVSSIVSSLADKVIMFTMYNDYWKFSIGGAGPYGVEYYWGLYGNSPE